MAALPELSSYGAPGGKKSPVRAMGRATARGLGSSEETGASCCCRHHCAAQKMSQSSSMVACGAWLASCSMSLKLTGFAGA